MNSSRQHAVCQGEVERLSEAKAVILVATAPGWRVEAGHLRRTFHLHRFAETMALLIRIAEIAERLNHHPNFCVEDKRTLHVELWTHKMSALTELDFEVAAEIDAAYLALAEV